MTCHSLKRSDSDGCNDDDDNNDDFVLPLNTLLVVLTTVLKDIGVFLWYNYQTNSSLTKTFLTNYC